MAAAASTLLFLPPGTSDWAFPGRVGTAGAPRPGSPSQLGSVVNGGEGLILLCRTQAFPTVRMKAQGETEGEWLKGRAGGGTQLGGANLWEEVGVRCLCGNHPPEGPESRRRDLCGVSDCDYFFPVIKSSDFGVIRVLNLCEGFLLSWGNQLCLGIFILKLWETRLVNQKLAYTSFLKRRLNNDITIVQNRVSEYWRMFWRDWND